MNEEKKPENSEAVETWFIDKEISTEKLDGAEIQVNSVSLHGEENNAVTSANDAAIIGGPITNENDKTAPSADLNALESGETTVRKSIMEDFKEPVTSQKASNSILDSEIPVLDNPDLVAAHTKNTEDTVFPDKSRISTTAGAKLSNLESAPEYLQEENLQTTAERRYNFMTQTKTAEQSAETELTWNEPQSVKPSTLPATSSLEETIFEGATVVPTIPSRAAAHLWSLLLTLLFLPLAWYYSLDVAQRLRVGPISPWQGGPLTVLIIAELIGAIICVFLVVFIARFSSLGTFFTGVIFTAIGIFTVFTPHLAAAKLAPVFRALAHSNAENATMVQNLMANIGKLLNLSAGSGLFLFIGIILFALGFVSHGARRQGRKDYLIKRKVKDFS